MRITRREILKAIRTEKLKAGNPIEYKHKKGYDKSCKVCAVGAVLRQKGVPNNEIEGRFWNIMGSTCDEVGDSGDIERALQEKSYMGALSIKFEKLAFRKRVTEKTIKELVKFVKKNFPKQITVKI